MVILNRSLLLLFHAVRFLNFLKLFSDMDNFSNSEDEQAGVSGPYPIKKNKSGRVSIINYRSI